MKTNDAPHLGIDLPTQQPKELAVCWDGHVHTHLSDADPELSPQRVCEAAANAGLGHIAVSDHDHMLGEPLRQKLSRDYHIDVISACEFSTTAHINGKQITVHIIGLWLPDDAPAVQKVLQYNQNIDLPGYCIHILKKLCDLGIDLSGNGPEASYELLKQQNPHSHHIARGAIDRLAVSTGHAASTQEFRQRYTGRFGDRLAFVPHEEFLPPYADIEDVMAACRLGFPVLCHLNYYQLTEEENHMLVRLFKDLGGEGIEVDYSAYTRLQQAKLYSEYAKPYGLLPTAGSDRHKEEKPFKMGDPMMFKRVRDRCRELHGKIIGGADL